MEEFFLDFYSFFAPADLIQCLYNNTVLTSITLSVAIINLLCCLFFYLNPFAFRRWFYRLSHWSMTMLFAGLLCFLMSFLTCSKMECEDGFTIFFIFCIEIMVLSCFIFFICSLFIKHFSVIARKTPF